MSRKKVIFVIVEGPSDEEALGVLITRFFKDESVFIYVMHRDITTEYNVHPHNILSEITKVVKEYASRYSFKAMDFSRIIHIIDMDGAFVPDEVILEDSSCDSPMYSTTEIRTKSREQIIDRNRRKRENINKISSTATIWKIVYQVFYMSCNLDHVLYDKLNTSDEQKKKNAFEFAKKYKDNMQEFIAFISAPSINVEGDYLKSWEYIKQELHSLERHTNLMICFVNK